MRINVNNPSEFTIDNLKRLIASADSTIMTQYRVTKDGDLIISEDVGKQNLENILFRLETNDICTVGKKASEDKLLVERIYSVIKENWPEPSFNHIDNY